MSSDFVFRYPAPKRKQPEAAIPASEAGWMWLEFCSAEMNVLGEASLRWP